MIRFSCQGCGRLFTVNEKHAGKKATCNQCHAVVVVPEILTPSEPSPGNAAATDRPPRPASPQRPASPPHPAPPPPQMIPPREPVRTRRLRVDAEQLRSLFGAGGPIRIKSTQGDPADRIVMEYSIRGVESIYNDKPEFRNSHQVEIAMTLDYPRLSPICRMLTPIFHPNIDESSICVGDHWTAAERLVDLVVRIGQMIAYQAYNIKSPLNGEAARWADLNANLLPTDSQLLQTGEN